MLTDCDKAEVRSIVNEVVGAHFRAAFESLLNEGLEPIVAGTAQLLNFRQRLVTMEESIGLLVESQTRVERAVAAATCEPEVDDEPWRESLH